MTTPVLTHTDPDGRQHFGPQVLTVARLSQYGNAWAFNEVEGFYNAPKDQPNMQLVVGQQYVVSYTSKPRPNGGNPYLDIKTAELHVPDGSEVRFTPQGDEVVSPIGQPAATADDWQETDDGRYEVRQAPKRDATRESIEKQVFIKEVGETLRTVMEHGNGAYYTGRPDPSTPPGQIGPMEKAEVFDGAQIEWMLKEFLDGLYELKYGTPPPAEQPDD